MRYASIAAIPLALAVSAPSYPQSIQHPSELQISNGLQSLEDVKRGLEILLAMQSAMQTYGGNLEESESGLGKEYHDLATFPSSEEGGREHIISTFLRERGSKLTSFTIFVDNINIQGYSNKPSQFVVFKEYYDKIKMHKGHHTVLDESIAPNQLVNNLLASVAFIANHLRNNRANVVNDIDLVTRVKSMEYHKAALLKDYGVQIVNGT